MIDELSFYVSFYSRFYNQSFILLHCLLLVLVLLLVLFRGVCVALVEHVLQKELAGLVRRAHQGARGHVLEAHALGLALGRCKWVWRGWGWGKQGVHGE